MKKIEEMRKYIMKNINSHIGINSLAVAEKYGVDRHTVVKHYKELTNQVTKPKRKNRDCYLLTIIKNYEEMILDPTIKLKATYMYILNAHDIKQVGSYSNFVQYVRKHYGSERKQKRLGNARYRYETPPGDLLQFDWIEDIKLELSTGEIVSFNLYSGTLAYSRLHYYRISLNKTMDAFVQCFVDNLIEIGGCPERAMTDNMSAIVSIIKNKRYIHPRVSQFFKDLGIKLILCKPRKPFTKGKVETSNKYREWISPYNKKFASLDEAMQIIPTIMMQCNFQPNSETNMAPIKLFNKKEKNSLKSLPKLELLRSYYGTMQEAKVSITSLIKHSGASYGVPSKYIGTSVLINEKNNIIEIYDKSMKFIVAYDRKTYGIHYEKTMYELQKGNFKKDMSQEEYEKMRDSNLNYLANVGGTSYE